MMSVYDACLFVTHRSFFASIHSLPACPSVFYLSTYLIIYRPRRRNSLFSDIPLPATTVPITLFSHDIRSPLPTPTSVGDRLPLSVVFICNYGNYTGRRSLVSLRCRGLCLFAMYPYFLHTSQNF